MDVRESRRTSAWRWRVGYVSWCASYRVVRQWVNICRSTECNHNRITFLLTSKNKRRESVICDVISRRDRGRAARAAARAAAESVLSKQRHANWTNRRLTPPAPAPLQPRSRTAKLNS
ncbi:hypothetical protein EVAR_60117_1 [Eumeta japonica]|uniref:Uncharacterized protein n=1 Tax=Eumeta variegata TaxID=151549 RepID=A0A4C1ZU68_EUMVA|nr:hypothetical protein EVAR_60117_1 [Eumeta japonica]